MDFPLPELGEGVYEAELMRWLVKPGDAIKHGQILAEVMTDKATMEVPAPFRGTIGTLKAEPGQQIKIGSVILTFDGEWLGTLPNEAPSAAAAPVAVARTNGAPVVSTSAAVKAAPSVRHMARKLGVDLATIRGSGPGGRILIDDLSAAVRPATPARAPASESNLDVGTAGTRLKLHGLRRKIAEHMVESKRTIPHYSYIDECDVTDLVKLRSLTAPRFAEQGVKLTYLSFFVKAAALALREAPLVNATLDESTNEIVMHDSYHVGVAVATPGGLIVPVVRDADKQDLPAIARAIESLSAKARAGKIRREDLSDGTFTVTSIGGIGGMISTPIIHHPQVGILGIGKIVRRPVYDENGRLRPADLVYLSFSFDHRVVDGAVGAVFGNAIMRHLRQPASLLLPTQI